HVQDPVAVVGDQALAPDRLAAQVGNRPRHQAACHRDHLDRQRELAQHLDLLGLVDDADELLAGLGDDLLAGERAAAALDQAVPGIALVGAVDVQLQRPDRVEVEHRDAYLLELTGAALGTGDGALDPALDPTQALDEIGHGRAGADADDGAVLDEFQGFLGGQL